MLRAIISVVVLALAVPGSLDAARSRRKKKAPVQSVMVRVKTGDTLGRIALRHHVSVAQLRKLNKLKKGGVLRRGRQLRVKERPAESARKSVARVSGKRGKRGRAAAGKAPARGPWVTHKVARGDSLWMLADRYDVSIGTIRKVNHLRKRSVLRPGMVLKMKRRTGQVLADGVRLPSKGPGYVSTRPTRSYGTPGTVRLIQHVYAEVARLWPGTVPAIVADLSAEHGGHLAPHRSHQRGVDVDVSYYKQGNVKTRGLEVVTRDTIDIRKTWDAIRAYLNTGHVTVIFMDWNLQGILHEHLVSEGYPADLIAKIVQYPRPRSKRSGVIRHSPGHHHHLHVRFDCVKATDACAPVTTAWIPDRTRRTSVLAARAAERDKAETQVNVFLRRLDPEPRRVRRLRTGLGAAAPMPRPGLDALRMPRFGPTSGPPVRVRRSRRR